MIRTEVDDISENLYKEVFEVFINYIKDTFKKKYLNEYVSFYIANAYNMNALVKCDLMQSFNEACESLYQLTEKDCSKNEILKILKDKYKLEITNDNPISIKELD